jgi:DNA-binding NtrC family response regulator
VRELENTIERAVVLTTGPTIARDAVSIEATTSASAGTLPSLKLRHNVEWMERETIRRALEMSSVKRHAAQLLGISPRALSHYLAKYPLIDQARSQRDPFPARAVSEIPRDQDPREEDLCEEELCV